MQWVKVTNMNSGNPTAESRVILIELKSVHTFNGNWPTDIPGQSYH